MESESLNTYNILSNSEAFWTYNIFDDSVDLRIFNKCLIKLFKINQLFAYNRIRYPRYYQWHLPSIFVYKILFIT